MKQQTQKNLMLIFDLKIENVILLRSSFIVAVYQVSTIDSEL
ncbi:unnamed protein product [Arabidopsis halleri]